MHDQWTSAELDSLLGKRSLTRRQVLVTSLATGFALAVQPVSAQTITTSAEGLEAGEVKIPVADGEIPAYRAMPAKGKHFPVVLVVQEIFGVHEHIKDVCRRFARQGYLRHRPRALCPPGRRLEDQRLEADLRGGREQGARRAGHVRSRRDAAWAARSSKGDKRKLAVTGFCWGGRITWLYAAHNKDLKAGVAWYGRLTGRDDGTAAEVPARRRARHQRAGARPVRRQGPGHPAGRRRGDARRAEGGGQAVRDHGVPRGGPWLPGRLSAELSMPKARRRAGPRASRGSSKHGVG